MAFEPKRLRNGESLCGPSTQAKTPPPETNAYGSQSRMLVKVKGKKETSVIYVGGE